MSTEFKLYTVDKNELYSSKSKIEKELILPEWLNMH